MRGLFPDPEVLSVRAINALSIALGNPTEQVDPKRVAALTETDLLRVPNMGRKSLKTVHEWLAQFDLHLVGVRPRLKPKPAAPHPPINSRFNWRHPPQPFKQSLIGTGLRHTELVDIFTVLGWQYPDSDYRARQMLLAEWNDFVARCVLLVVERELRK